MPDDLRSRAHKVRSVRPIMVADINRGGWGNGRGLRRGGICIVSSSPCVSPLTSIFLRFPAD